MRLLLWFIFSTHGKPETYSSIIILLCMHYPVWLRDIFCYII